MNIKIFVSHRIDKESETIKNPIFVNVRCGATFDSKNSTLIGDDSGDNISSKRLSFCEFTVQYWAWKNVEADYYGMCHYRRYLSFSKQHYKTSERNFIEFPYLNVRRQRCLDLLNEEKMKKEIEKFDVIVSEAANVRCIPTPQGKKNSVYEHWAGYDGELIHAEDLNILIDLIKKLHFEYYEDAKEYFANCMHRGYNCFIMKKSLFNQMNQFQFDILFELERHLDMSKYSPQMIRTPGYFGEILFGIYIYSLTHRKNILIKEVQLAFFYETRPTTSILEFFSFVSPNIYRFYLSKCLNVLLPVQSRRRLYFKKIMNAMKI